MVKHYSPLRDGESIVQIVETMPNHEWLEYDDGELISSLDAAVVAAARVSLDEGLKTYDSDKNLIRYLYRNHHSSPFEQVMLKFRIVAPLPIVAQHMRHRTWAYNQVSRRYTDENVSFYLPRWWRTQGDINRQASNGHVDAELNTAISEKYSELLNECLYIYEQMLDVGVAREQARFILPQGMYASYIATVSLHNLMHFLRLRMAPESQYEMQLYAVAMFLLAEERAPITMEEFKNSLTFSVDNHINYLTTTGLYLYGN